MPEAWSATTSTRRPNSKAESTTNADRLSAGMSSRLAQQSIGKEADNIEENEFIGEDADPPHYGVELTDRAAIAAAVFDVQQRYGISDRKLLDEAKVSHHTLAGLKEGKRIADASLMKLFSAAEALRQEADPIAAAMDKALRDLRRLKSPSGNILNRRNHL